MSYRLSDKKFFFIFILIPPLNERSNILLFYILVNIARELLESSIRFERTVWVSNPLIWKLELTGCCRSFIRAPLWFQSHGRHKELPKYSNLESEEEETKLIGKLAIYEQFTYFVQSSWNFVKMIVTTVDYLH